MAKHICSGQCAEEQEADGIPSPVSASCVTWASLSTQSSCSIFVWKLGIIHLPGRGVVRVSRNEKLVVPDT